jgi:3-oxoacyl-[acyl-carrier protein] reductase
MRIDLSGKIALVTGGSRGIGREICLRLAEAGARVIVNYHRSKAAAEEAAAEIARRGREADLFAADIARPEAVAELFDHVRKGHGRLDVLINNAGITKDNLLLAMDLADWDAVHEVNLRGAFLCTKAAVEMMLLQHSGKIINIASVGAVRGGRGQANYASAKGGLVAFTRACAVELAGKGIQVNAILPGFIATDMTKRLRARAGDALLERIPQERFGDPADVADLAVFLASERANYITGQAIAVDGGLSVS